MKRNSILFLILAGLLVFTYFYEELGTKKEQAASEAQAELFSQSEFGTLRTLKLAHALIEFKGDNGELVIGPEQIRGDFQKVKKLLDLLGALKIESELAVEEVQKQGETTFFGENPQGITFVFDQGEVAFKLGRKLDISESFYVKVQTPKELKYAVVKDTSARQGIYWRQDQNSDRNYVRLAEWLAKDDNFFYNLSIVRGELKLQSVAISNLRNRPFALDYKNTRTDPAPPPGLEVSASAFSAFEHMLGAMKGHKVVAPVAVNKLEELLATMSLETVTGERAIWEIYRRHQGDLGPFLYMKGDRLLYQLGTNELRAFFSNVQEFWDLRPIREVSDNQQDFVVTLTLAGESAKVHFPNILKPYFFAQAERISVRSADDDIWAAQFKELLKLDFKGTTFSAKLYERELMIENQASGVRYYYRVGEEIPFPLKLEAYQKAP